MILPIRCREKCPPLAEIHAATGVCLPAAEHAVTPDAGHMMHVMNPAAFDQALVRLRRY
jgi:pimeloyl-ACP methyl ester carboxylesterase